jgi:hypothetical protein
MKESKFPQGLGEDEKWPRQKIIAIVWLGWLAVLVFQNLRAPRWKYSELFNPNPKRGIRRAFFWRCLFFFSKYGAWSGIITSAVFLSFSIPPWFPYDLSWLDALQKQQPELIWLFLTTFFLILRFFQVGIAAPFFPGNPGTAALCSWLENKYLMFCCWGSLVYAGTRAALASAAPGLPDHKSYFVSLEDKECLESRRQIQRIIAAALNICHNCRADVVMALFRYLISL